MPFVKLDCNMLRSTLWYERLQREIFITALLMAEPIYTDKPMPQLNVRNLKETGWSVPPGNDTPYGFVAAAGIGIVRQAIVSNKDEDIQVGLDALEKLGSPEQSSRTPDFDGRRLVRVNGGYVVLNFGKYRERDYTAAERQRRHREKVKASSHAVMSTSNAVTSRQSHVESRKQKQSTEAEKNTEGANGSRPPVMKKILDFEKWIESLIADPTYARIDVRREYGKMVAWCKVRGKQPTQRRFINWLNNVDAGLPTPAASTAGVYGKNRLPPPSDITEEQLATHRAQIQKLSEQWKKEHGV